jgi:hypothetical protein
VSAYIYAAVEPGTDNAFALILPDANSAGMQVFRKRPVTAALC